GNPPRADSVLPFSPSSQGSPCDRFPGHLMFGDRKLVITLSQPASLPLFARGHTRPHATGAWECRLACGAEALRVSILHVSPITQPVADSWGRAVVWPPRPLREAPGTHARNDRIRARGAGVRGVALCVGTLAAPAQAALG